MVPRETEIKNTQVLHRDTTKTVERSTDQEEINCGERFTDDRFGNSTPRLTDYFN